MQKEERQLRYKQTETDRKKPIDGQCETERTDT